MEQGIFKNFIKYASLNILGMIGLSCYILADTFFIANGLGSRGLTALNLAIPVYSFISGFGLMIGMGGATRFSILKESGEPKKQNQVFSSAVLFALTVSVLLVLAGIFGTGFLSGLLGADETVAETTGIYLRVILLFSPMFLLNNVLLCFVRNDGAPKLSMAAMLIGSLSNIVFDYIFIFPLQMGMFGAALATGFAPVISLLILTLHFIKKKNSFCFVRTRLKLHRIKDISMLGVSSLITEISSGIVIIVFNLILLDLAGNLGVAAYSIIANIALVATAFFTGLSQGIQPIISSSYGAADQECIKKTYGYAVASSLFLALLIYAVIFSFTDGIIALFNKEENKTLLSIASNGMLLYFTAFLFAGINVVTAVYFSSVDAPRQSFLISILRGFLLVIPLAFLLSHLLGVTGVWLAFPAGELITCCFSAAMYFKSRKRTG